jgi:hypothetical protein
MSSMPCAGRRNGVRAGGSTPWAGIPRAACGGIALRGHGVCEGRRPAEEERIAGPVTVIGRSSCRNHGQARCTVHARCDGGSQHALGRAPQLRLRVAVCANGSAFECASILTDITSLDSL